MQMFGINWGNKESNNKESRGGYLYKLKRKQSLLLPQWNRRWFCLEGTYLKWYESKDSVEASGSVDLSQVTSIEEFDNGASGSGLYR